MLMIALLSTALRPARALLQGTPTRCRALAPPTRRAARLFARQAEGRNPDQFERSDLTITEWPLPVLREKNKDVVDFDDEFQRICDEMLDVMYQADGVGLASTQVNIDKRFFVYNPTGDRARKDWEFICANPRIFEYSEETETDEEGCLSSRSEKCAGRVRRSTWIWVEFQDEEGRQKRKKLKGFEARVFQHEYDHIEGVLHFDRFSEKDRARIQPTLDLLLEAHGPGGVLELSEDKKAALQPPLAAGRMPPATAGAVVTASSLKKKPKKVSAGFGGFGGGGGKKKS